MECVHGSPRMGNLGGKMTQLLTPRVHTRQALNLRTQLHRQRIIPPRTRGEFRLTAFRRQRTARGGIQRNGDFGLREERTVSVLRRQMYQQPHKRCRSQSTSATCMRHQAQLKQRLGKAKFALRSGRRTHSEISSFAGLNSAMGSPTWRTRTVSTMTSTRVWKSS